MMGDGVTVECGSRLHLGFTNLSPELGRCYGSIGVGLDLPRIVLTLRPADELRVEADRVDQVLLYVERFGRHFQIDPRVHIIEEQRIPEHAGLGSGTRVALALGLGLSRLFECSGDILEIARAMERGRRSSVGILTFAEGGFVIDAGHRPGAEESQRPTVLFHRPFPEDWRFVVCVPEWEEGLSGRAEEGVFRVLTPPRSVSERICCITQLELLPALLEEDIETFGRALTEIDRGMGSFFAETQGGQTAQTAGSLVIERMLEAGAWGGGQSSWGPAVYGLVHADNAHQVERAVEGLLEEHGLTGLVMVARGRNTGASVSPETRSPAAAAKARSTRERPLHTASRGRPS